MKFYSYRRKTSRKSRRFDTAVAPGGRQLMAELGNRCWSCQVLSAEQSWKLSSMVADPRKKASHKKAREPDMVVHAYTPRTQEAEAERFPQSGSSNQSVSLGGSLP